MVGLWGVYRLHIVQIMWPLLITDVLMPHQLPAMLI